MRYGSVCSGVEAASLAWEPLGWQPQWFAEVDKFPSAVLAHHWPTIPNLGDITRDNFIKQAQPRPINVLVGGTPCQSFSVAGLRKGMDDDRGNLSLQFCRIVDALQPQWVVYENVPGVLSSGKGRDFGSIVGALVEIGYDIAWRILDAQYFGVPQRRRRVFLVGHLGQRRGAAAVLFERESIKGHIGKSAKKRQKATGDVGNGVNEDGPTHALTQAHSSTEDGTGRGVPLVANPLGAGPRGIDLDHDTFIPMTVNAREDPVYNDNQSLPLGAQDTGHAIGFIPKNSAKTRSVGAVDEQSPTLDSTPPAIAAKLQVRRLTPVECERLQGMPDNHTRIPWRNKPAEDCPDGPRYKAIGNSMAVPVMRWIGERIIKVENVLNEMQGAASHHSDGA
jgi:DNA (cytosine-5)-methyltransferase 1